MIRRAAAMPAAPAPTITTSMPERGSSAAPPVLLRRAERRARGHGGGSGEERSARQSAMARHVSGMAERIAAISANVAMQLARARTQLRRIRASPRFAANPHATSQAGTRACAARWLMTMQRRGATHARRRRQGARPDVLAAVPQGAAEIGRACAAADRRRRRSGCIVCWSGSPRAASTGSRACFGLTTDTPLSVLVLGALVRGRRSASSRARSS